MAKKFKSEYKNRPTKPEHEMEEFGPGKGGLIICPDCNSVYYKKSWHHGMLHFEGKETMPVEFKVCPADQMIKNGQYEGKVVVKNIPKDVFEEIVNLIKNVGDSACEKDSMHRVFGLEKNGGELTAFTTENELAASIARKIGDAHAKAKVKISYQSEPGDVCSAVVEF